MSEEKQGFLFNVTSNIGDGHQVSVAFNLPVGSKKKEMDGVLDEYFGSIKRAEARLRLPTAEAKVAQQKAKVEGIAKAVERLRDAPQLNGKRRTPDEAQFQQSMAQLDADKSMLEILEVGLAETIKEAEVPECTRQAS